jgi:hypothetical protein
MTSRYRLFADDITGTTKKMQQQLSRSQPPANCASLPLLHMKSCWCGACGGTTCVSIRSTQAPLSNRSGGYQPQLVARGAWLLEREGHHTSRVAARLNGLLGRSAAREGRVPYLSGGYQPQLLGDVSKSLCKTGIPHHHTVILPQTWNHFKAQFTLSTMCFSKICLKW